MSSQKLREFIGQVKKNGIAKANHYFVELTLPPVLQRDVLSKEGLRQAVLFCEQAEIPGINLDTQKVRTYGEVRESVYDKTYDQLQLAFYVDNAFSVKSLFDTWINSIYDPVTRHLNYPELYTSSKITIYVEDTQDKKRYAVNLFDVYPKTIAPIQLSFGSSEVIKLNVTLIYKYATYDIYDNPRTRKGLVDLVNGAFSSIQRGGISGALGEFSEELSNYDYVTNPIPESYFSAFSDFQNTASNSLSNLFGGSARPSIFGTSEGE